MSSGTTTSTTMKMKILRPPRRQRGTTLLEAMIAGAIFAFGMIGAIQFLMLASRQNTSAGRLTHAGAIASHVRGAMEIRGRSWLVSADGPLSEECGDSAVKALAGPLSGMTCVIDLDAYEGEDGILTPGYPAEDRQRYRRVLVYEADTATPPRVDTVTVVVSFEDAGRRLFARQSVGLYNLVANQAGVEL